MDGKAIEYFDLWEADRDSTDQAKSYEELLTKVKGCSKRYKRLTVRRRRGCITEVTPWMLEPWEDGVGAKAQMEDTTKETVFMLSASKARAKANEIVTIVDRQSVTQESALTRRRVRAQARDSKDNVSIAAKKGHPARELRNTNKEG